MFQNPDVGINKLAIDLFVKKRFLEGN